MYPLWKRLVASSLTVSLFCYALAASTVQADMVSTATVVESITGNIGRAELLQTLDSRDVQTRLEALGVDPDQARARIAALTPAELNALNQRIDEMPAGSGLLGAVLIVFILFVITDAVCATDVFSFVHCINK